MVQRVVELNPVKQDEYILVATFLPVRRWVDIIPFLRMSTRIQKQLGSSEGAVRYAVKTDIPHKRFWTLSVWTDKKLMHPRENGGSPEAIKKFESWAGEGASFVEYKNDTGRLDWEEAERQLQKPTFYFSAKKG